MTLMNVIFIGIIICVWVFVIIHLDHMFANAHQDIYWQLMEEYVKVDFYFILESFVLFLAKLVKAYFLIFI